MDNEMAELPNVRITADAVYFGEQKLPDLIAEKGVSVIAGGGTDVNRLTVEFIVGRVVFEDSLPD